MEKKYHKRQLLGNGATAQVYLVEEIATGKLYAMKVCENTKILAWEAEVLKKLKGGIFPEYKEYSEENREYLVMEYIEGKRLQEMLDTGKPFEPDEVVYIMDGLLRGLEQLHLQKNSIIYRDVKPSNIMIDTQGRIRLIDLGAACYDCNGEVEAEKGNQNRTLVGTYGYAAPEQFWEGVKLDKTCDIYGAGKVLAYLLSGKNPAEPPYNVEAFCKESIGISPEFLMVLERSMAVNPQARYEDCESMRRAIYKAYEASLKKKWFKRTKKSYLSYQKCIWKSEYRRIF